MMAGMDPFITFERVGKIFGEPGAQFTAVEEVTLQVGRGEFVTVVGPSGCGKSTVLNMTAGVLQPTTGRVTYNGIPVAGLNLKTGYMTQNDHLLPWRTVAKNIAVPLEIRGEGRAAIRSGVGSLMELVGLTGFEDVYPSELSGGMRKRVALARILAYDPETLLMDEPFAALDAQLRLRMQAELRSVSRRLGKTVIFVTHDLDEAVALADRCIVFSGRPGTVSRTVDITLPPDRDLARLRHEPAYAALTASLWDIMMPSLEHEAV